MANNELEFQDIYKEYHQRVASYLGRMVGQNEAQDLAQEVFMKVNNGLIRISQEAIMMGINLIMYVPSH